MAIDLSLFKPSLVFFGWECATSDEVFDHLAAELEARGLVAPTWREAVGARERVFSTGLKTIGCGLALPHADAEHTLAPFIAIARPATPVPFEPMGGIGSTVPADIVIALGFNHADDQIGALQHLMGVFADEERAHAVLAATTPEELVAELSA